MLQGRCWPDPTQARLWLACDGDINTRLLGQFILSAASTQGVLIGLGAIVGLSAAGALRGGQLLMGPMNFILMASSLIGMSELVRFHSRRGSIVLGAILISAGTVADVSSLGDGPFLAPRVSARCSLPTLGRRRGNDPGTLGVGDRVLGWCRCVVGTARLGGRSGGACGARRVVTAVMLPLDSASNPLGCPGAAWGMGNRGHGRCRSVVAQLPEVQPGGRYRHPQRRRRMRTVSFGA